MEETVKDPWKAAEVKSAGFWVWWWDSRSCICGLKTAMLA